MTDYDVITVFWSILWILCIYGEARKILVSGQFNFGVWIFSCFWPSHLLFLFAIIYKIHNQSLQLIQRYFQSKFQTFTGIFKQNFELLQEFTIKISNFYRYFQSKLTTHRGTFNQTFKIAQVLLIKSSNVEQVRSVKVATHTSTFKQCLQLTQALLTKPSNFHRYFQSKFLIFTGTFTGNLTKASEVAQVLSTKASEVAQVLSIKIPISTGTNFHQMLHKYFQSKFPILISILNQNFKLTQVLLTNFHTQPNNFIHIPNLYYYYYYSLIHLDQYLYPII